MEKTVYKYTFYTNVYLTATHSVKNVFLRLKKETIKFG